MKLNNTYLKLILIKNKTRYLTMILTMIIGYAAIAVIMVYIDNILILNSDYPNYQYLYSSIRAVCIIAGISFVLSQYYNIMKSGFYDDDILVLNRARKKNTSKIILLQGLLLIFITIPLGLFNGNRLTGIILNRLDGYELNSSTSERMYSINTFFIAAGAACIFIIVIGVYLNYEIKKISLTESLSDQ